MRHLGSQIGTAIWCLTENTSSLILAEHAGIIAWALYEELRQLSAGNSSATIEIHEDLLTQWVATCIEICDLGERLNRELPHAITHARAIDLAGRLARCAWAMHIALLQYVAPTLPRAAPSRKY